jgi:molecular chaperone GrpE
LAIENRSLELNILIMSEENKEDLKTENHTESENLQHEQEEAAELEAVAEQAAEPSVEAQVAEWKDKYLRLYADFENFRRQRNAERLELLASAGKDMVVAMLPILDDFERAVKANETSEDLALVKEGFNLIHHKMLRQLESKGLKAIESNGMPFDVDFHEAVTRFPAPDESMKGKVVDTLEKGYLMNDKVIRYAKVVVGE